MKEIILEKLKDLEREFDVKVLYACESGSRAWGFASPDSDYDVRFIYVHKREFYLSIDDRRDVIDLPINDLLDINGWELRKMLRLFRKSNGALYEWLQSPIVYREDLSFTAPLRSLMPAYFSNRATTHHYLSMAKRVLYDELQDDKVKLKRYFYALRPVLAAKWIVDFDAVPPMEFGVLRKVLPDSFSASVDKLLAIKADADESFLIDRDDMLNNFVHDMINYCEGRVAAADAVHDSAELNALFNKFVK